MITNNNTKDVAYLGCYEEKYIDEMKNATNSALNCPNWRWYELLDIFLFDCNGCRYGFRIKQLKTK